MENYDRDLVVHLTPLHVVLYGYGAHVLINARISLREMPVGSVALSLVELIET